MRQAARDLAPATLTRLSPAARAALAGRLAGRVIPTSAMSATAVVTPRTPVSSPTIPAQLSLSAQNAQWRVPPDIDVSLITLAPSASTESYSTRPHVELMLNRAEAGQRYLLVCDLSHRAAGWSISINEAPATLTWESELRAAALIPPQETTRWVRVRLAVDTAPAGGTSRFGTFTRCEVSAIRV